MISFRMGDGCQADKLMLSVVAGQSCHYSERTGKFVRKSTGKELRTALRTHLDLIPVACGSLRLTARKDNQVWKGTFGKLRVL